MQVTSKVHIESRRLTRQGMWDSFILFHDHCIPISIPAFAIRLAKSSFPQETKSQCLHNERLCKEPVKKSVTKQRLALIPLFFCTRNHQKARQTCRPAHPSNVNTKELCLFIITLLNKDNLFTVHSHERETICCSFLPSGRSDFSQHHLSSPVG